MLIGLHEKRRVSHTVSQQDIVQKNKKTTRQFFIQLIAPGIVEALSPIIDEQLIVVLYINQLSRVEPLRIGQKIVLKHCDGFAKPILK